MPRRDDLILLLAVLMLLAVTLGARLPALLNRGADSVAPIASRSDGAIRVEGGVARIDVNLADRELLDALPGIGPVLAGRIVEYRTQNGPFRSLDELTKVRGIGEKLLERIRDQAFVPSEPPESN